MPSDSSFTIERREFLKLTGAMTALTLTHPALAGRSPVVSIVLDVQRRSACADPVLWAAGQLRRALVAKGAVCNIVPSLEQAKNSSFFVFVADPASSVASHFPQAEATLPSSESLRLTPGILLQTPALWVSAIGERGFVYGLLEMAERVQFSPDATTGLHLAQAIEEHPANQVRSVMRLFCSEIEDKPWFYDRAFWRSYLDALAVSRFNRFSLALGLGYDFPRGVTGDYLHFPYPYLLDVPGYNVRVIRLRDETGEQSPLPLSTEEREKNLETLRFIAAETSARGLQFQLGLWTHAYQWTDSPLAHHRIEGITPETHAAYSRDALAMLLKACPQIQGLTMRVHGESGIPEGSYPFWKTLFEAISGCGRKIEIDMHAKGVNQTMIDMAVATGMPVKLSAKYSAEHQSLGYHQADIRELEIPQPSRMETGVFNVSNGERRFTRYGYADFLAQGAKYQLLFRLWPGTQRHLLSGDPEMAAAYGRTSSFCGAAGLDIMESLTFKGREGSGLPGGRCAYAEASLNPQKGDWEKFEYFYRVWGRCLYNPNSSPEAWRTYLASKFGHGANSSETALANASRVLPLLTSAHLASASNHAYWPEIYDNMPIVLESEASPYSDTPNPKCFATVSPLDPQLFSTIVDHAADLLGDHPNPKYSPVEVAQWLEDFTAASNLALTRARLEAPSPSSADFRRMEEDVLIQIGLGRFFAAKLRSGVLFEIYRQTGFAEAGKLAVAKYQEASAAWGDVAARANKVYQPDITYGSIPMRRGSWSTRIAAIDRDLAAMRLKVENPTAATGSAANAEAATKAAAGKPSRPAMPCTHKPPASFHPGSPLPLILAATAEPPFTVRLLYRHVNQAERWRSAEMQRSESGFHGSIPGDYTGSVYALQYYFVLMRGSAAWLYPGFNTTLSNQPYYAVAMRS
ncbi:MAG: hypothetical protein WA510_10065 [Acidobacteriaceae bacterium]